MTLMTASEYIESLRKLKTRVYMFGEKIDNWVDHPIIRPSINCVAMTYALAQDPKYKDLMTATSNLTGHTINRFTHLHQSPEDLIKKVKMQRLLGQKTASCFQRCVGMDSFNAVYSTTYEIDEKYGTHYHENFKKFLIYVQDNDLTVDGAMTDPKGDRSKAPHEQKDPDVFVHVVERRPDGIVVCGAKVHQTGSINSHWHIFMPTISMKEADKDWAVSFACPTDAEGLYMVYGRQSCDTRKMEDGANIDLGNAKFGGQEALVVLDHVFIPNDMIFLNGETEFAGMMVERFAGYQIDLLLANVCKQNVTRFPYEIVRLAEDIAGGVMVTMPSEKDFKSDMVVGKNGETIGEICKKFFVGRDDIPTEKRQRIMRFIENMCLGSAAVGYRTESLHGAGSPQAQRIMIARQGNIAQKKEFAKIIAGIVDKD